jgi:hypothetical protein
MKPEQQRIKIAEACGWELKSNGLSPMWSWQNESLTHRIKWVAHKEMASQGVLPDYLNDLNAMHEAEKNLKPKQQVDYWNWLDKLVGNPQTDNIYLVWGDATYLVWGDATFANAAQRAEAFLRTLNLWEE